jgi:2-aminoethylphosphonate-pyruvate transaminase
LRPDLCHRQAEFGDLQNEVRARLARVYPATAADYEAVLLTGSGTAAVEAMVTSMVPRDGRELVVQNGVYGERIAAILRAHGRDFEAVWGNWMGPMPLDAVEDRLRRGSCSHVAAVHHETTTGRLNDLAGLGALCRRYGAALLLDAVSSFGGEEVDAKGWNLEGLASTANKCLHGVPGVCFVLARRQALEGRATGAASLYLDLFRHYPEQRKGGVLFTPAVQSMFALQEALKELEEQGGWARRRAHYALLSGRLSEGLGDLGVRPLLPDPASRSAILTAYRLPAGVDYAALEEHLKRWRFVIYPGQQALQGTIFRVAVMGDLSLRDAEEFLRAFAAAPGQVLWPHEHRPSGPGGTGERRGGAR